MEDTVTLNIGDHTVKAAPTNDGVDRTSPEGKTSAVHFLRFSLSPEQVLKIAFAFCFS